MVRSVGIAAVVVSLAWTGLAGAQSSSSQGSPAARPHYIIVNEDGQRPQRCQVLKTWHEANGAPAFQVQAVDTGEILTIVGSGPAKTGGPVREMATRIFRWGAANKPPADAPVAPPSAVAMPTPPPPLPPMQATPVVTPQPIQPITPAPLPPRVTTQAAPLLPPLPTPPARPAAQPSWVAPLPPLPTAHTAPATQLTQAQATSMVPPQTSIVQTAKPAQPAPKPTSPVPSPTKSTAQSAKPAQPLTSVATPVVTPQPLRLPPQSSTTPQIITKSQQSAASPLASKPSFAMDPAATQPAITYPKIVSSPTVASSKPAPATLVSQPKPVAASKPVQLTPMGTQVVQYTTTQSPMNSAPSTPIPSQPRLVPMVGGTTATAKGNCCCSSPCNTCSQPCPTCNQSSCLSCTPPLRQGFMSRLFKSNSPCPCTEVACQPAQQAPAAKPTVAPPVTTVALEKSEPAKPSDWRESWGKVEPWKETAQANSVKPEIVSEKRADPAPVHFDPPKDLDPIKAPDQYRDLALQTQLNNSKITNEPHPVEVRKPKLRLFAAKRSMQPMPPARPGPAEEVVIANAPPSPPNGTMGTMSPVPPGSAEQAVVTNALPPANGTMPPAHVAMEQPMPPTNQPRGRLIQLAADEPNAFWSPSQPSQSSKPEEQKPETPKVNAFDREAENQTPQGIPPTIRGMMQLPYGTTTVALPPPPRGPMPMLPQGPQMQPMRPDSGIPDAMGNAFTLPGTRRPIPADFGATPQEPNGFDQMVQLGQGSPPQDYSMGTPAMARPPMPNMMAMGPNGPMGANPLMNVPPAPQHPAFAGPVPVAAPAPAVPEMLTTLKDSLYPSERETAAERLSELDWRDQPQVVEGLMKAARQDPAATVRAACIHALAHMKVDTAGALALVRELKSDSDPLVRHEAEEALSELGGSEIQQATHK